MKRLNRLALRVEERHRVRGGVAGIGTWRRECGRRSLAFECHVEDIALVSLRSKAECCRRCNAVISKSSSSCWRLKLIKRVARMTRLGPGNYRPMCLHLPPSNVTRRLPDQHQRHSTDCARMSSKPIIREASHAGSWYTDNEAQLNRQLDGWLNAVTPPVSCIGPQSQGQSIPQLPVTGARMIIAPYV